MQTRSQMSIEDNDVDNISLNSIISHKRDNRDVSLMWEHIFQVNYVSLDEIKKLHDDFIDFKRYVAEVLNIVSNFKRVSANNIYSEPSITDPSNLTPTNLKDENVAALRSEIKDLKEQNKTCLTLLSLGYFRSV